MVHVINTKHGVRLARSGQTIRKQNNCMAFRQFFQHTWTNAVVSFLLTDKTDLFKFFWNRFLNLFFVSIRTPPSIRKRQSNCSVCIDCGDLGLFFMCLPQQNAQLILCCERFTTNCNLQHHGGTLRHGFLVPTRSNLNYQHHNYSNYFHVGFMGGVDVVCSTHLFAGQKKIFPTSIKNIFHESNFLRRNNTLLTFDINRCTSIIADHLSISIKHN